MSDLWTVEIDVKVSDPQALWRAARDYLNNEGPWSVDSTIGTEEEPDIGGCLIMLLDRSEHLADAAEIENSTASSVPDLGGL